MNINQIAEEIKNRIAELDEQRANAHKKYRTIKEAGDAINACDRGIWKLARHVGCNERLVLNPIQWVDAIIKGDSLWTITNWI